MLLIRVLHRKYKPTKKRSHRKLKENKYKDLIKESLMVSDC